MRAGTRKGEGNVRPTTDAGVYAVVLHRKCVRSRSEQLALHVEAVAVMRCAVRVGWTSCTSLSPG